MSTTYGWVPGDLNLTHGVLILAPPAAAIGGAIVAPLAMHHPGRAGLALVLVTWLVGTLLWPLAAIVMPFWTSELSCVGVDGSCDPAIGLSAQQIVNYGVAQLGYWLAMGLLSPILTWIYLPAMAVGALFWVPVVRASLGVTPLLVIPPSLPLRRRRARLTLRSRPLKGAEAAQERIGRWEVVLEGHPHAIDLGQANEATGLPGAVICDGTAYPLEPLLAGPPQTLQFEIAGYPAALQQAFRVHESGLVLDVPPLPFTSPGAIAMNLPGRRDWWTYELFVDGMSRGTWVLHENAWSFVPAGSRLPDVGADERDDSTLFWWGCLALPGAIVTSALAIAVLVLLELTLSGGSDAFAAIVASTLALAAAGWLVAWVASRRWKPLRQPVALYIVGAVLAGGLLDSVLSRMLVNLE